MTFCRFDTSKEREKNSICIDKRANIPHNRTIVLPIQLNRLLNARDRALSNAAKKCQVNLIILRRNDKISNMILKNATL